MSDYSYIGVGQCYLEEVGGTTGLLPIGNVSALSFAVSEEVKELKDFTKGGGGTRNEVRRVSSVEASMTLHDLSPENLARVLYGVSTAGAAGALTNQAIGTFQAGAFDPFPAIAAATPAPVIRATNGRTATTRANTTAYAMGVYIIPAVSNGFYYRVTTAGTSAAAPPTFGTTVGGTTVDGTATLTCMGRILLTAGTDYNVTGNGVTFTATAAATAGEPVEADFTAVASDLTQALTSSGKEDRLYFDGLNEARSGKRVLVDAFRVRIGAAQNLGLIGEEYAALEVTGKVLADTTKLGVGVSQYFTARQER
jgi:hypothetical protein